MGESVGFSVGTTDGSHLCVNVVVTRRRTSRPVVVDSSRSVVVVRRRTKWVVVVQHVKSVVVCRDVRGRGCEPSNVVKFGWVLRSVLTLP